MPADSLSVVIYDFETQHWSELVKAPAGSPSWSKDGRYVYFLRVMSAPPAVLRVRISDHKVEQVVDLKNFRMAGYVGFWLGLAPDDSRFCSVTPAPRKFTRSTGRRRKGSDEWRKG